MLTDEDICIINTTSTYQDIPKDCKLVGAEFDQDYPPNSTRLNIIGDGPFWIGATIEFKRNINPIGNVCTCHIDNISYWWLSPLNYDVFYDCINKQKKGLGN